MRVTCFSLPQGHPFRETELLYKMSMAHSFDSGLRPSFANGCNDHDSERDVSNRAT